MGYIDNEELNNDIENLRKYISEELQAENYSEMMLLLRESIRAIQPARNSAGQTGKQDYIG